MVSVCMTAFNQEKYIAAAIESALSQTHPCQIIIGEDHSTDRTLEIAYHYHDLYPDRIGVYPRHQNLGLGKNLELTWGECRTEYIAILEADDVWSSPLKLAKQVLYMDAHPACSLCFTLADGSPQYDKLPTLHDVLKHNLIVNSSVMYRRRTVPPFVWALPYCDLALHSIHGPDIGMIPLPLTRYRFHPEGMFTARPIADRLVMSIPVYKALSHYLPAPYSRTALETCALAEIGLAILKRSPGHLHDALFGGVSWLTVFKLFLGQSARMLGSSVSR